MAGDTGKKKGRKRKTPGKDRDATPSNPVGRPRKKAKPGDSDNIKNKKEQISASSTPNIKTKVDVDKQCGVPLPNGGLCTRSLTCKSHPMGAKRAVPGRSQPYDILLAAYQRRNQVRQATLHAQQQLEQDNEALMDGDTPLNPEEEFQQVMAGVVKAHPVPLERKVIMPTKLQTRFFRMREMLIGSVTNVPPLPPMNSNSNSSQYPINAVMNLTGALLGRTIVFNANTGAQYARPPRVYVNSHQNQTQQQQQQLQQQQYQQHPSQSTPQSQQSQQQQLFLQRQRQLQYAAMQQQAQAQALRQTS